LHEDPGLGCAADHLRGLAALLAGRHGDAALLWTTAARRDWQGPLRFAPVAYLAEGGAVAAAGGDPLPAYGRAVEAVTRALDRYPDWVHGWVLCGMAHRSLGSEQRRRGENGEAPLRAAIAAYDQAVERGDRRSTTRVNRANARLSLARVMMGRGGDAREVLLAALEDCKSVVQTDPTFVRAGITFAGICQELAARERQLGASPLPWMESGWKTLDGVWRSGARGQNLEAMRAVHLSNLAWTRLQAGQDGRPLLEQAVRAFDDLLGRYPTYAEAWSNRGATMARFGMLAKSGSAERVAAWRRAVADYGKSVELNPGVVESELSRISSRLELVLAMDAARQDALPELARALADIDAARTRWPDNLVLLRHRATVHSHRTRLAFTRRTDPEPHLRAAIRDLNALLERNPAHAWALFERGTMYQGLGSWCRSRRQPWKAHFERGVIDYRECARVSPKDWRPFAAAGDLLENLGRLDEAIAAFESALQRRPGQPTTLARLKRLRARQGK
jgi:tetratricopeptide (TPR) repeat protein